MSKAISVEARLEQADILLVEDNLGDARLIREMLADAPECDWRVVQADRLESAIELLSSKHFDVCLLDLNLPDSSALATLEQLINFFDLPIIVLTGLGDAEMGLGALRLGAQDYLVKDRIDEFSLNRALRYAIERFALEQRYAQMFSASNDAIFVIDTQANQISNANPTALLLLGYAREDLLALSASELSNDTDAWHSYLTSVRQRGQGKSSELSLRAKGGRDIYVDVSAARIQEGRKQSVVVTARDVSEKRKLLKELEQQANHDALTGLYNRYALERQFKRLSRRGGKAPKLSLISLDLNDFKRVNDTLGHAAGDELLQKVAERILRVSTPKDTVARSGGDEFTLLLQATRSRTAESVSERLRDALEVPFTLTPARRDISKDDASQHDVSQPKTSQHKLHMRVSIGVATLAENARDFAELMRRADQAMYEAKRLGGVVFYSEATNERLKERLWIERALRDALAQNELELYFQPLACLDCDTRPHAEALLRWRREQRGFIAPDVFIGVAEETGLILELDRWVIREALAQAELGEFSVAINVSPISLREPDFVGFMRERLAQSSLLPEHVTLEVTEGVLANPEWSLATLNELSELGLQLMIDDFGTGYSSLDYLVQFPLNGLKVDRSFTAKLFHDDKAELISRTVVQLAKNLGITTIVEGIEEEAQLDWSRSVGSDRAQGYLIARPMPFAELLAWCAQQANPELETEISLGV